MKPFLCLIRNGIKTNLLYYYKAKMCKNCLLNQLEAVEEYAKEITEHIESINCECCKSFPRFLKGVNEDLKVLCMTKLKRMEQVCPNGIRAVSCFEEMVKKRIDNKLANAVETMDDISHDITNERYLANMNNLKDLHDTKEAIEEADHR